MKKNKIFDFFIFHPSILESIFMALERLEDDDSDAKRRLLPSQFDEISTVTQNHRTGNNDAIV